MSKYPAILLYVFLVITVLSPFASTQVGAQTEAEDDFVPRIVTFVADHSILDMPEGIAGLVMESDQCYGCKSDAAQWQLLGDSLRISKVARFDQKYPLLKDDVVKESQIERISFHSADLVSAITQIKPLYIGKRIPHAKSGATREWDPVRLQWSNLADFSTFYEIVLKDETSMAQARETLEGVPGIKAVGYVPERTSDGFDCQFGEEPWLPNDTLMYKNLVGNVDTAWYIKAPEDQLGGLNMPCAWALLDDGHRGDVKLAIIDYLVDTTHPDLNVSLRTNISFVPGVSPHGTNVAGCAAAIGNNAIGVCGMAPDARAFSYWYNYDTSLGYSPLFNGHNTAVTVDMAIEDTAQVIIMATSGDFDDSLEFEVLRKAKARNCVIVVPTGNIRSTPRVPFMSYPSAWDSLCISVGMLNGSGGIHYRSNYSPCDDDTCLLVDVVAPGEGIRTTDSVGGYDYMLGTSASSALISGIVALAKSYNPYLTLEEIEEILEATADTSGGVLDSTAQYGAGRVDAYAFIDSVVNTPVSCCIRGLGNVNCDAYDIVDITDLSVLIDHLFLTLTPLCCEEEADLDYSDNVDVTDSNILIDHLFLTLAPLDSCP